MKIDDYFVSIERGLSRNPQISKIEEPITLLTSDDYNGLIRCRVTFWDGSFLDIYEVISTELGYPVRINYLRQQAEYGMIIKRVQFQRALSGPRKFPESCFQAPAPSDAGRN